MGIKQTEKLKYLGVTMDKHIGNEKVKTKVWGAERLIQAVRMNHLGSTDISGRELRRNGEVSKFVMADETVIHSTEKRSLKCFT